MVLIKFKNKKKITKKIKHKKREQKTYKIHTKRKQKRKKRHTKNKYSLKGGGIKIIHVFIRPYYKEIDEKTSFSKDAGYYYGDFKLKIPGEKILEKFQSPLTSMDFQEILDAFPSSNSRPNLNVARNQAKTMLKDKGIKVDLFQLDDRNSEHLRLKCLIEKNYLTAIQKDIHSLNEAKAKFEESNCLKSIPREDRCKITLVNLADVIENPDITIICSISSELLDKQLYFLHKDFNPIFKEIFIIAEQRKIPKNKYGKIETYGADLWFIYVKIISQLELLSSVQKISDDDAKQKQLYLKCITNAFDLMSQTQTRKDPVYNNRDHKLIIKLNNDSLDNDIDDIFAIIFLEYIYQKYDFQEILAYKDKNTFVWADNKDSTKETVRTRILDPLHNIINGIIYKNEGIFTKSEPTTIDFI